MVEVFELDDRQRRNFERSGFYGVTNPFILPESSGVRYYDHTTLDGGHLLAMLNNAKWISAKQIRAARVEAGEIQADEFADQRDRWFPRTTPAAFSAIILKPESPTDEELAAAIHTQFQLVLQRPPMEEEQQRYLRLSRSAIELAGNTEGLRQMLIAVLLESEFLYRLEFGEGEIDEFGRQLLAPREAAYAISYALGDRRPDAQLLAAADEGRLLSAEDYEREVRRLLADDQYYRGRIDPTLVGRDLQSPETSHPRLVRFFREFFGYPAALRVFKDLNRSNGYYRNPDRGSMQTPGYLVNEADMMVEWYLRRDEHVFENLLNGDQFFVAPVAEAPEKIAMLQRVYERFKDSPWEEDPEGVAEANLEFLRENLHYRAGAKQLTIAMTHVTKFRDRGLHPHPVWDYAFGRLLTQWVHSYNIEPFEWSYPLEQPFTLEHRRGLLTHPAWLIAHSQNAATDPVRRGRWVREKLLAGRVPDVPITVDARIPEVPHQTLRARLVSVTENQQCWKCHEHMNPLGLAFESYDDFGRFRTEESIEHPDDFIRSGAGRDDADIYQTQPADSSGWLTGTGDPALDGEVTDALDLVDRLARSERVRQSMIRHAFRFFMGRNELESDAQTLIDADRAYVESNGSFREVVVSLLTSDSFRYRKRLPDELATNPLGDSQESAARMTLEIIRTSSQPTLSANEE
ncbi:MAG: DUF1588 domain-containing protein [Pirellulaceae bacterium]